MSELGMAEAAVVGHSMGGNVLAHLAQRHPERVSRLVFVDGAVSAGDGESRYGPLSWLVELPPVRRWAQIAMRVVLSPDRITRTLRTAYHDPESVTPDVAGGYLAPLTVNNWELALLGIVRDSPQNGLEAPLSSIQAPTLLLWGAEDTWVPLGAGEALHAAVPGSKLVVIPDAGHLPMEEQPELFNAELVQFLLGE
jgi:pimeloyl-ACP methyl ester carboxylesterase